MIYKIQREMRSKRKRTLEDVLYIINIDREQQKCSTFAENQKAGFNQQTNG